MATPAFGLCFHREFPSGDVVDFARSAEALGYDELWLIEDCFFTSGPALAAAALVSTDRIGVGIGILPAVARNPAITAMEIATLAGLAPGRFHAGIGHGVQSWMGQMGARKASPLTALDETITTVRRLLRGERVSVDGRYVHLDDVALVAPPSVVPLVSAGVQSARSLHLAGRRADGTILAELAGPAYVRWARAMIADGAAEAGRAGAPHRLTVFCSMSVDADGDAARRAVSPFVAGVLSSGNPASASLEFFPELAARAAATSWLDAVTAMPVEWWGELGAFGTPDDAASFLRRLIDAGADAISVFPDPDDPITDARRFAEQVLPLLG